MKKSQIVAFLRKVTALLVCTMMFFQLTSCGTILYPERRGQETELSRLDVKVVVLDGILLFLFVLPGVIAYAVDFSTGCIYLPPGYITLEPKDDKVSDIRIIQVDPAKLDGEMIAHIVQDYTGQTIKIDSPDLLVFHPNTQHFDVPQELSLLNKGFAPVSEGFWFTGAQARFIPDADGRLVKVEVAVPTDTHLALR